MSTIPTVEFNRKTTNIGVVVVLLSQSFADGNRVLREGRGVDVYV
jgi:hypothetical protein